MWQILRHFVTVLAADKHFRRTDIYKFRTTIPKKLNTNWQWAKMVSKIQYVFGIKSLQLLYFYWAHFLFRRYARMGSKNPLWCYAIVRGWGEWMRWTLRTHKHTHTGRHRDTGTRTLFMFWPWLVLCSLCRQVCKITGKYFTAVTFLCM